MHTVPLQLGQNFLATGSGSGRHGQEDLGHTGVGNHVPHLVTGIHVQAGDSTPDKVRIVIDESHRTVQAADLQRRQQLQASRSGSINGHRLASCILLLGRVQHRQAGGQPVTHEILAGKQAQAPDQDQAQRPEREKRRPRKKHIPAQILGNKEHKSKSEEPYGHRLGNAVERHITEMTHHGTVHTHAQVHRNRQNRRQKKQNTLLGVGPKPAFITQTQKQRHPE